MTQNCSYSLPPTTDIRHRFCKSPPLTRSSQPPLPHCGLSFSRSGPEYRKNHHGHRAPPSPICEWHRWIDSILKYVDVLVEGHLLTVRIHRRSRRLPATLVSEMVVEPKVANGGGFRWVVQLRMAVGEGSDRNGDDAPVIGDGRSPFWG